MTSWLNKFTTQISKVHISKIKDIVEEYQIFAADQYGISDLNADMDAIVETVLTGIPKDMDLLNTVRTNSNLTVRLLTIRRPCH